MSKYLAKRLLIEEFIEENLPKLKP